MYLLLAKHEHFCQSANITQHEVPSRVLHDSSHDNGMLKTEMDKKQPIPVRSKLGPPYTYISGYTLEWWLTSPLWLNCQGTG